VKSQAPLAATQRRIPPGVGKIYLYFSAGLSTPCHQLLPLFSNLHTTSPLRGERETQRLSGALLAFESRGCPNLSGPLLKQTITLASNHLALRITQLLNITTLLIFGFSPLIIPKLGALNVIQYKL
jgi:hypothetical protein